jgi:hypothetical protein
MSNKITKTKKRQMIALRWTSEPGFPVIPVVHQQTRPRLLRRCNISITAKAKGRAADARPQVAA